MEILFDFLIVIGIIIAILVAIFLVLLSMPKSKLRESIFRVYSIVTTILSIISVIYIVSPLDIIPDFIPIAGQSDDLVAFATALTTAFTSYVSWKKSKGKPEIKEN